MYNHSTVHAPDLFLVVYLSGNGGVIRDGSWIHRKPRPIRHVFELQVKIYGAKQLVPWDCLSSKQIRKGEMLRILVKVNCVG